MALIDLTKITPHCVSRDLSGYITYVYGPPKSGKTTLASQMPKTLLLALERGYNALPGVMAQDITSWAEIRQVVRELKKPEVKELFSTVAIDTVDIAANLCDKYVCSQNQVDTINQIPYGQGWNLLKKEFEEVFRTITQLGYAVCFIAHSKDKTFKREDGSEYNQIVPSVANTYNSIIENMADLYGYMHPVYREGENKVIITLRSIDGTIAAGGRFKYITPEVDANYNALVSALNDAIDKEAGLTNNKYVTDEKNVVSLNPELDFDELMADFNKAISLIPGSTSDPMSDEGKKFSEYWLPRISQIIERYLGKGKKVSQCTRNQVEQLYLIVMEVKDLK